MQSDVFQDDLFPDTASGEPSLSSSEWLGGKNADVKLTSLAPGFVQKERNTDFKPSAVVQEKVLSEHEVRTHTPRHSTQHSPFY